MLPRPAAVLYSLPCQCWFSRWGVTATLTTCMTLFLPLTSQHGLIYPCPLSRLHSLFSLDITAGERSLLLRPWLHPQVYFLGDQLEPPYIQHCYSIVSGPIASCVHGYIPRFISSGTSWNHHILSIIATQRPLPFLLPTKTNTVDDSYKTIKKYKVE